jgi:hypothetical protein
MLNFTPQGLSVTIGGYDFTDFVMNFKLSRPLFDFGKPYSWSGDMNLVTALDGTAPPQSFDDWSNAQFWEIGYNPVVIWVNGFRVATLRITEYQWDEDDRLATLSLGDILAVSEWRSPGASYKGMGFPACTSTSVQNLVSIALTKAQIPSFDLTGCPAATIEVPPNKPDGSWLSWAQTYLGERGYCLYTDKNETVRIASYPFRGGNPLFARARNGIENFKRAKAPIRPHEIVRVTGSAEKYTRCSSQSNPAPKIFYADYTPPDVDGVAQPTYRVIERIETYRVVSSTKSEFIEATVTQMAKAMAFPKLFPNDLGMFYAQTSVTTKSADSQGRVRAVTTVNGRALGMALPTLFGNDAANALVFENNAELVYTVVTENADGGVTVNGGDGVVRFKQTTSQKLYPDGDLNGFVRAISDQTTEIWSEGEDGVVRVVLRSGTVDEDSAPPPASTPPCNRFKNRKIVLKRRESTVEKGQRNADTKNYILGSLLIESNDTNEDSTPPAFETLAPQCPTGQIALLGESRTQSTIATPFREKIFTTSCKTLQSNADAGSMASLVAALQHQRYRAREVNMPLIAEWLANPDPLPIAYLHNGKFILENDCLVLGQDEMQISWIANLWGQLSTPLPELPDYVISLPPPSGTPLALAPIAATSFPIGVPIIPIRVQAIGGIPSYTWSASSLPAGLSLQDTTTTTNYTFIVGTPTGSGTTATINVTDSASNAASTTAAIATTTPATQALIRELTVMAIDFGPSLTIGYSTTDRAYPAPTLSTWTMTLVLSGTIIDPNPIPPTAVQAGTDYVLAGTDYVLAG